MAKTIMVQGTMSNAGKSLVATGLCRIFKQDGFKTAPFKSQNMALNSYITADGLEIGRAQAVQAEAAGIEPTVLMNPILLKPTTDMGSQIIVNGRALGNMTAAEYYEHKKALMPEIVSAFNRLNDYYDVVVIEGAGSPAEINLQKDDLVNMGMARLANAPVLLVGDIDRGGVFAQLYGTVMLLPAHERAMIKAVVINKFRGDLSILKPGLGMLKDKLGIPVLGTIPYSDWDIDDEDSLSERFNTSQTRKPIDIAVIRLPFISNFTDFAPFERSAQVSLRYVRSIKELHQPDMIIIPGTKSTMADLMWMRQNGLEASIVRAHSHGAVVFGVCGGFQMLGEVILDPCGYESPVTIVNGLKLLPVSTVFEKEKTRKRVSGVLTDVTGVLAGLNGLAYTGYEIHMGASDFNGVIMCADNAYGSYVHGVFDGDGIADAVISALCRKKGITPDDPVFTNREAYRAKQYDALADTLRQSLDMDMLYAILNNGL